MISGLLLYSLKCSGPIIVFINYNLLNFSIIFNRVHSLWRRLENSFYTLRHKSLVDNPVISWDALNALLWLAFGIEDINRDVFLTKFITFGMKIALILENS